VKPWYPDEQDFAGPEHLDANYVASYDRKAQFDPSEDIAILTAAGMSSESTVIDMGAGTGTFAFAAAGLCRRVIAVDVSAAMTGALTRHIRESQVKNVEVVQAGFLSYEHHGDPADIVFSRNALHHLPDFWKAVALVRITAALRPGGIMRVRDLIFDFDPEVADDRIESWMSGAVSDPSVGFTANELAVHVRTEFSTYSWVFEQILDKVGLEVGDRSYVRAAYGAYTCTKRS